MKVIITSCEEHHHWYAKKIGEVFEVDPEKHPSDQTDSFIYKLSNGSGRGIYGYNCEPYSFKKRYPTLLTGYNES